MGRSTQRKYYNTWLQSSTTALNAKVTQTTPAVIQRIEKQILKHTQHGLLFPTHIHRQQIPVMKKAMAATIGKIIGRLPFCFRNNCVRWCCTIFWILSGVVLVLGAEFSHNTQCKQNGNLPIILPIVAAIAFFITGSLFTQNIP
jgi:hypothetical protein